jgi:hypothetical protein
MTSLRRGEKQVKWKEDLVIVLRNGVRNDSVGRSELRETSQTLSGFIA